MEIISLIKFTIKVFAQGVVSFLFQPIAWIFLFILYLQYKRIYRLQKEMYFGDLKYSIKDMMVTSILSGILAALFINILMTLVGITFSNSVGLQIVVLISLILLTINPRYVCLSYSGGLFSLFLIISKYLIDKDIINSKSFIEFINFINIDIPSLMAIIGIMHLIEAVLIWIDGYKAATPAYMKKEDKIIGVYVIQRFWPIPLIFYFLMKGTVSLGDLVSTPDWWPLFKPSIKSIDLKNAVFMAIPVFAMLGYGDFAISTDVKTKVKRTSIHLIFFSIILIFLAFFAIKYNIFAFVASIFSPIAHEFLIIYERYIENKKPPLWIRREDGIVVLDSMPNSVAEKMGIKAGDKIVAINNYPIRNLEDLINFFQSYYNYVWVEVVDVYGNKKLYEYKDYQNGISELGILTIPKYAFNIPIIEDRRRLLSLIKSRFKKQ
ncbi:PDZ domain (Also known as DHR or GLGF) [Caloramator fervidus]|uniref:PDZ domain (Also known as DHR or GLGF) n=1 Tax=Caloramator fervidus TaxID=29344 RepID=A0A1H5TB12_9CLOT|nr:PDZ domain-containing protein [Caloramator fervidus]SEF60072.1 PDZ domain (Also known as DHR or GLGF) [Caloramator fervidus]